MMDWENEELKEQWEACLRDGWNPKENYVFISYASRDWPRVYPIVLELRKRGINVYIDTELKENQSSGWLDNVKKSIINLRCRGIITFLSIHYLRSYACLIEQLINYSNALKKKLGRRLPVFFYSLQKEMEKVQTMWDHIYDTDVAIESESEEAKMLPEESNYLQEVLLSCQYKDYATADKIGKLVGEIRNKHDVATTMYSLIFDGSTAFSDGTTIKMPGSIVPVKSPGNCANGI